MNFDEAFEHILKYEGGATITNDKDDAGGLTKYGISKRAHPTLDIANLTLAEAKEIYFVDYWKATNCEALPPHLKLMAFDCAVNQGANFAKDCIKRIFEQYPLSESGQLIYFFNKRKARYLKNKQYTKFGKGWMNRLNKVNSICIAIQEKQLGEIS